MKKFIGHIHKARAAFTLMEVNLAIFIMAVGVLAMTSLYPLGFRESQQSRDDVRAAVAADQVLGQLTAALSSRNIKWNDWAQGIQGAVDKTSKGWLSYFANRGNNSYVVKSRSEVNSLAEGVGGALASVCKKNKPNLVLTDKNKYAYGLVAQWGKKVEAGVVKDDRSRVSISFRLARRSGALMTAPIYYTEVHFQGDQEDEDTGQ